MNDWEGAGIILFHPEQQTVLLLKRKKDGLWSIPGGKLSEGESFLDAAVRETYEETRFQISSPFLHLGINNGFWLLGRKVSHCPSPILNALEHSAFVWAKRDALPEPLYPGMHEFIERAFACVTE